jgi:3-oxoacyl-[acyl-carrier protein] reductase
MGQLDGRVALVTGGSRGIGAAIVMRLAAEGASVAFTFSASPDKAADVVRAVLAAGGHAMSIEADAASVVAARHAVQTTVDRFGRLDILVNNAGVSYLAGIEEYPECEFERAIHVNVRGMFITTQEAVRHMDSGGRIIMIGSVNSDYIPYSQGAVYALTKGAIAGFVRGLARDLGPRGITVNNIQPGPIDTDMNPANGPFAQGVREFIALQRYGRPEEVAEVVAFLAGPQGAFITGAQWKVDGGYTA